MAAALYNKMTGSHDADSAGTEVDHPEMTLQQRRDSRGGTYVIDAMEPEGIDISHHFRTQLTEHMLDTYDRVISMAQPEHTPSWLSSHPKYTYWAVDDPGGKGLEETVLAREQIKVKLNELLGR